METALLPKVGRGRGRQHRLNAETLVGQLVLQRMGEREDEGFRRAVHAVQPLGANGDGRCDVDDRASAALNEGRRSRIGQAGERSNVERDHLLHLFRVGLQERGKGGGSGIVDEHGDAGIVAQPHFDLGQIIFLAEVGGQDLDGSPRLAHQPGR